ncbi:TPA: hypothetical protein HA274_01135 [Candidatus Bathyarchaeota archaeon]|nr:hypothetical protein [Candidatus Bathyarchaeota archaeon]
MKNTLHKLAIAVLLFLLISTLASSLNTNENAEAEIGEKGYFEGDVPLRGVYLQSINCYPTFGVDKNEDGVMDAGYTFDLDGNGVEETVYLEEPLIVDLAANGFYPGDMIMISHKQSVRNVVWNQIYYFNLFGLFSSSAELYADNWLYKPSSSHLKWPMIGPINRVPGAIDAALGGYDHGPGDNTNIWKQGQEVENDITEDFQIRGHVQYSEGSNGVQWTPNTWAFSNAFWIRIPPGAKYLFVQRVGYWLLDHIGYVRVTIDKDSDGDAIPDSWEKQHIDFNKDGMPDLVLAGADPLKKDIYVEVDYMEGHEPSQAALDDVVAAFRNCPQTVKNGPISVHIEVDDSEPMVLEHQNVIRAWDRFDKIKETYFGTLTQKVGDYAEFALLAKAYVYHYCLFVHGVETWNGTDWRAGAAGYGETYGNDFIVSLGIGFEGETGSRDQQAATFMHELGHNLGLLHGGGDRINYKPNYLSIMNYLFLFDGNPLRNRPLTFSSAKLASLDEAELDEPKGVKGANWDWTVHSGFLQTTAGPTYIPLAVLTSFGIDWNNNGDDTETNVKANVNNYPKYGYVSQDSEVLEGHDDWSNIRFDFHQSKNFAKGVHVSASGKEETVEEITWEIVKAMQDDGNSMVGGPTGPVQVLDVPSQGSTEKPDSGSQVETSYLVVGVVVAVVAVAVISVLLIVRKRRK